MLLEVLWVRQERYEKHVLLFSTYIVLYFSIVVDLFFSLVKFEEQIGR
jgi:hypothetical protein